MDTIQCCHCHGEVKRNSRVKHQRYCKATACQQARKNAWERTKLQTDPGYLERRKSQKKSWYKHRPGDRYQANYRTVHPEYQQANTEKQRSRNLKRARDASVPKIVKTDASAAKSVLEGPWYALIPYDSFKGKKIVKTDALIVQIVDAEPCKATNNHKGRCKR